MKKLLRRVKPPSHKLVETIRADGYELVAGIDEVGRGCLAGPVTAAAVILPPGLSIRGVRDSKLLSLGQRERLAVSVKRSALAVGIGWATSAEIDQHGLTHAVRLSGLRALENLRHPYDAVLLDGNHKYLRDHCQAKAVVRADGLSLSVAAASIVAKVARDRYMKRLHELFPQFGFATNVGYATPSHLAAIKSDISPLHRRLFKPVASLGFTETLFSDEFDEEILNVD